ncbi:hypothetical protein D3C87_81140 [compost metagenome]
MRIITIVDKLIVRLTEISSCLYIEKLKKLFTKAKKRDIINIQEEKRVIDLRKVLYREKEETLDKLDALMIFANFEEYYTSVKKNSLEEVYVTFKKGVCQINLFVEDKVCISSNSGLYGERFNKAISGDEDLSNMSLDQAIDLMLKTL